MRDGLIDRWWSLVVTHPRKVIAVVLAITAFFGYFAPGALEITNTIEKLMTAGDPDWAFVQKARGSFGGENIITLAISDADPDPATGELRDVFTTSILGTESALVGDLSRLKIAQGDREMVPFHSITALSDFNTIIGTEMGMRVIPVMDEPPTDQAGAELVRERAMSDPILRDANVNRSGTTIGVDLFLKPDPGHKMFLGQRVARMLEKKMDDIEGAGTTRLDAVGESFFDLASSRYTTFDLTHMTPVVLLLVAGILALAFRSAAGVLLPILTPLGAIVWTLGFVSMTGSQLTVTTGIVPVLIIAVGTASTMHVVAHHGLEGGGCPAEYVRLAMRKVGGAVFLAGLTTALGLLSLLTNDIINIREMGLYSAFGITADFLLSMSLVPALLTFQKRPVSRLNAETGSPRLERILLATARFSQHRCRLVIAGTVVVFALSAWGGSMLRVETNYMEMLKAQDPLRVSDRFIRTHLTGLEVMTVYVRVSPEYLDRKYGDRNADKPLYEPEVLKRMAMVHDFLYPTVTCLCGESLPLGGTPPGKTVTCPNCREEIPVPDAPRSAFAARIQKVASLVDFVKQMNKASHANDPAAFEIPDDRKTIATYVFNHGHPEDMEVYVVPDFSFARIFIRTDATSSRIVAAINNELKEFCARTFAGVAETHAASTISCLATGQNAISWGQVRSLGMTLACISIILFCAFRSIGIGLLALPPNLLPIAALFGLMGFMGTDLDVGTSIVGCLGIGIAVDDTVHFLTRYLHEVKAGGGISKIIERTTATTGRPIVFTSVALALGFIILVSSNFVPVIYLGFYTAVTMITALIGDLILLPALLAIFKPGLRAGAFLDR